MSRYTTTQARKVLQLRGYKPSDENLCQYFLYDGNGIWWDLYDLWVTTILREPNHLFAKIGNTEHDVFEGFDSLAHSNKSGLRTAFAL